MADPPPPTIRPTRRVALGGPTVYRIGVDVSERAGVVPASVRVLVIRRPKVACRGCAEGGAQALAPARFVEGGLLTKAAVAHVLVSKDADHLPVS